MAGTQLARNAQSVRVTYRDDHAVLRRPTLSATSLGMYRAYKHGATQATRPADRHLTDVAFLLSLVQDPRRAAAELGPSDRKRLTRLHNDLPPEHHAWRSLEDPADAQAALHLMARQPRSSKVR